jgi:hypothetical protein
MYYSTKYKNFLVSESKWGDLVMLEKDRIKETSDFMKSEG